MKNHIENSVSSCKITCRKQSTVSIQMFNTFSTIFVCLPCIAHTHFLYARVCVVYTLSCTQTQYTKCSHFPCSFWGLCSRWYCVALSFFISLRNRSVIALLFIPSHITWATHFSRTSLWLSSRKVTTFFLFHPHWSAWKEIGRKFLLIFYLSLFVACLAWSSAVQCILCYYVWIAFCIEFHLLSPGNRPNNSSILTTLHIGNNDLPSKAWPIFVEVVIIVCQSECNAMLMNWKLEASSATVSVCLDRGYIKGERKMFVSVREISITKSKQKA